MAKNSIKIPEGVSCVFDNNILTVKGKHGENILKVNTKYTISNKDNKIYVLSLNESDKKTDPMLGTTRAHVLNSINGAASGFSKTLELKGTGYRASISGSKLVLQIGYSHNINYDIPERVKAECPKPNIIKLSSANKELLGDVAAKIRSFRKPEPFKGKGIKYDNEFIVRKEGKKK